MSFKPGTFMGMPALARPVELTGVPSGQPLELLEVLVDEVESESWLRFRFLAPAIDRVTGSLSFEAVALDFEHLCRTLALPYLEEFDLAPAVVTVTLLDRNVPFGASDQEATQYVEVFRIEAGACVWEEF